MNAYELADYIQENYVTNGNDIEKLANMLRQQADRIAELEKQLDLHKNAHHKCVEIMQEKHSEPVAWMQMHHKDNIPTKFSPVKVWEDDIPLYTTPQTKPLSDEEIEQFAKRKANQILMDLLMPDVGEPKKIDWNIGCTNQHLVNFARAIEERHGIK